jgi:hypothetical protein
MLDITPAPVPLERKTFNKHFDNFLKTGQINPEILEHCDAWQQYAINEVKKALIRIEKEYET